MKTLKLIHIRQNGKYQLINYITSNHAGSNTINPIRDKADNVKRLTALEGAKIMGNMIANGQQWVLTDIKNVKQGESFPYDSKSMKSEWVQDTFINNLDIADAVIRRLRMNIEDIVKIWAK